MSNQPDKDKKIFTRASRPLSIGGAMGGLLRMFGARASDADLAARWDEIMGAEIANVARLAAIRKTRAGGYNVVLRPANPAFALQLSYMADDITKKINRYFGRDAVEKISFRK